VYGKGFLTDGKKLKNSLRLPRVWVCVLPVRVHVFCIWLVFLLVQWFLVMESWNIHTVFLIY